MTMLSVPVLSIVVWLVVGAVCGWLETLRVGDGGLPSRAYWVIGAAGACLGGMFFLRWGELVPNSPILAPLVSGVVGASIIMTILSFALRLRRAKGA